MNTGVNMASKVPEVESITSSLNETITTLEDRMNNLSGRLIGLKIELPINPQGKVAEEPIESPLVKVLRQYDSRVRQVINIINDNLDALQI